MYRRTTLAAAGTGLVLAIGGSAVAAQEADDEAGEDDDENGDELPDEMAVNEFSGEGTQIVDDLEIAGGLTVVEGQHEGWIFVQAIPSENDQEHTLVTDADEFVTGTILESGTYDLYVNAEEEWELTVIQPQTADEEPAALPLELTGTGPDWTGPIEFEEGTNVTGRHNGQSDFEVYVYTEDNATELVFHVLGEFAGETTLQGDSDGYLVVDADGEWELEFE
ncbi:hypothetical protein [Natronobeatus ordinarius]|uniref:hypothetical protein n=1 Tax=Natronobeatus ordinarius TaxID=2963433 RepID=UPI0020CECD5C|nr:hypothetical protein [Natronobeatus ordinarius]